MKSQRVTTLSPDGYSRFFFMVDVLNQLFGKTKKKITILDVGGGSDFFRQELRKATFDFSLTVLDIIERPTDMKVNYIQADATDMTFADGTYDVVISTDTLEHIPATHKQAFLDECLRVASQACIIAAPFDTESVNEAEVIVNNFNKKLFGVGQSWLEEHLALGKPSIELFSKTLKRTGFEYDDFGTQNITTWLLNTHINLLEAKLGLDQQAHRRINEQYNKNILEMGELEGPTYRHFFVMYKKRELKGNLNVGHYQGRRNNKKYTEYIHNLFSLFADPLSKASRLEGEQRNRLALEEENSLLKKKLQEQAELLKKVGPLLKLSRSELVKSVYGNLENKG